MAHFVDCTKIMLITKLRMTESYYLKPLMQVWNSRSLLCVVPEMCYKTKTGKEMNLIKITLPDKQNAIIKYGIVSTKS